MLSLNDKQSIWSLIDKYDNSDNHKPMVESLSNIIKGYDITENLIVIGQYMDLKTLDKSDIDILDKVFSKRLEVMYF